MESKQSPFYVYENGRRKASPLLIIFIVVQFLFILAIIITIAWTNQDNTIPNDGTSHSQKSPKLTINELSDKATFLTEYDIEGIQKKVLQIVSENTENINTSETKATIRDSSFHSKVFENGLTYINMIIDIPTLEQSYQVFFGSDSIINMDVSTVVLCLDDKTERKYENFECKSSDENHSRDAIASAYLKYFKYNYFSVYFDPESSNTITINPSVTYENSEATKNHYIDEVKSSIESLGFSPNKYNYYVRTADDVDYRK